MKKFVENMRKYVENMKKYLGSMDCAGCPRAIEPVGLGKIPSSPPIIN